MEISITIKEILLLLEKKVNTLQEGIEERGSVVEKRLESLKRYVNGVDNSVVEARRINYQGLIQYFIQTRRAPSTRSKWVFFKEDYIKKEDYLNIRKLEAYLRNTFGLNTCVVNVSREGHKNYKRDIIKLGGFHFKGNYYSVYYEKDRHYLKAENAVESNYIRDSEVYKLETSLEEVLSFKKKLLHLQNTLGEDKIITLNEKQIKLIEE